MSTQMTGIAANTPQGHRGPGEVIKYPPHWSALFMADLAERKGAAFVVLNEFGPALTAGWVEKGWKVYLGPNNNAPNQRYGCNAVAYDPELLKVVHVEIFRFTITDRNKRKRKIHIPILFFKWRATGEIFAVFAIHVPADPDSTPFQQGWVNLRLKYYARKCSRYGIPPLIFGDRNNGHPEPWWVPDQKPQPGDFFRLEQHAADWAIGRIPKKNRAGSRRVDSETLPEVYRNASDHKAAVKADFTLENATFTGKKFPSPNWYKRA